MNSIPLIAMWMASITAHSLEIEGVTLIGKSFRGALASCTEGILEMAAPTDMGFASTALPVDSIEWIRPVRPLQGEDLLVQMEPLVPLLHKWDGPLLSGVIDAVARLAEDGQWTQLNYWSRRILGSDIPRSDQNRLLLLNAWSLIELGALDGAREILKKRAEGGDRLQAAPIYCRLLATLHHKDGDAESARYWATLPMLRIPAATGRERARLERILAELDSTVP